MRRIGPVLVVLLTAVRGSLAERMKRPSTSLSRPAAGSEPVRTIQREEPGGCLSEEMAADLAKCIRSDLDCADICVTTGNVLSRHTGYDAQLTRAVLQACAVACRTCGSECERHTGMPAHCRVGAEACRRCEQACNALLASLGGATRTPSESGLRAGAGCRRVIVGDPASGDG